MKLPLVVCFMKLQSVVCFKS